MAKSRVQKSLIEKIEKRRDSRVLVYITSDRPPFNTSIAEDVVRLLYDHLLALDKLEQDQRRNRLDLFLYSRGGNVSVPWRLVSMFREFFDEFNVLVPYKAYSAATMIALGADKVVMGRKAELGPIDPTVSSSNGGALQSVSVEDVSSYISFIRDQANINDQDALAQLVGKLSDDVRPLIVGMVNREQSHIRLVARKLLASHRDKIEEGKLSAIVEALTEKLYSHGHAIGRKEAREIGIPIEYATAPVEDDIWELFEEYESELDLRNVIDQETLLGDDEESRQNDLPIAILESTEILHRFETQMVVKKNATYRVTPR